MLRTPALRGGILTESCLYTMRLPYARFKESQFLREATVKESQREMKCGSKWNATPQMGEFCAASATENVLTCYLILRPVDVKKV